MKSKEIMLYLAVKYKGNYDEMYNAIRSKLPLKEEDVERVSESIGCKYVTILDQEYPQQLRTAIRPPFVLFYKGNLELINGSIPLLSVVGSREPSSYSSETVGKICGDLAKKGVGIICGLAKGIDTVALKSALPYGKAIAVLGTSLDSCYPLENYDLQQEIGNYGLLLSEFPPGVGPSKINFPARNRITVGLSYSLLVGEVQRRSGTLISVTFALNRGCDIGVLPSRATEDTYNNRLIQDGAILVNSSEDVLDFFSNLVPLKKKIF